MPWVKENDKTYWMPDVLPEPTEEHKEIQSKKLYLIPGNEERVHPGWTYADNVAYVDDEYLFQNEGWRLIIDDFGPKVTDDDLKRKIRNAPENWEQIDERTVKATYTVIDFTDKESKDHIDYKWTTLRNLRNKLLSETDWIILRSIEENLVVSSEVISYRNQLRNIPETITDILKIDFGDLTLWPSKPEVYFEV